MLSDARGWISLQGQLVQHPQFLWYVLYWWLHIGELSAFPNQRAVDGLFSEDGKSAITSAGYQVRGKNPCHQTLLTFR